MNNGYNLFVIRNSLLWYANYMDLQTVMLIYLITCFFSFGVQSLFYAWYRFKKHQLIIDYKHVFQYHSGIIGDGVLVPVINIFCVQNLYFVQANILSWPLLIVSICGGVLITFAFHHGQKHYELTNWTMPEVGKWNLLGLYHAIFMHFESSFLCLSLITFLQYLYQNGISTATEAPIRYGFLTLFLFALTFFYDYWFCLFKDLYVGRAQPLFNYARSRFKR
jgi:hypothetical protein